jgi:TRAP-type C4-dicarboxylate transport system permease small subunit
MDSIFGILQKVSKILNGIAAAALTFMMMVTVVDVLMRAGGHTLMGPYEIVSLTLAVVIGLGIPQVSLDRANVYMEILLEKLSKRSKAIMNTATRVLCLILFVLIAYNLFAVAGELHASGEVSPTIKLPFYPVAYAVGVCCFLECFVFIFHIVKIWRGQYE